MRLLPCLAVGEFTPRLPLSDHSAATLAEVLLAGDNDARMTLTAALAADPPLLLWAVATANLASPVRDVASVDEAAAWLAEDGWRRLVEQDDQASYSSEAETAREFADLAARSIMVARLSAQLAADEQRLERDARGIAAIDDLAQRSLFLGLLHTATDWFALVLPHGVDAVAIFQALLPASLVANLAALARLALAKEQSLSERRPAARYVARALAIVAAPGMKAPATEETDELARLRADWLAEVPGVGRQLQFVAARVSRLETLETRFAHELEREKLEALAEFAAGAGHEINNPLAVMSGRAQLLLDDERDRHRRRELAVIHAQSLRIYEMLADLMLFARPPAPKIEPVDLAALVERVLDELRGEALEHDIRLVHRPADGRAGGASLVARGDPMQLDLVLRALCCNAIEAIHAQGNVEITVEPVAASIDFPGGAVRIVVVDDGPGIAPDVRRHLFDPFYSGRSAGRGLGMGLAKSWRIVTNLAGTLEVSSPSGRGTRFVVTLPAADS